MHVVSANLLWIELWKCYRKQEASVQRFEDQLMIYFCSIECALNKQGGRDDAHNQLVEILLVSERHKTAAMLSALYLMLMLIGRGDLWNS